MTIFLQAPEDQTKETWTWQTDVQVADDGSEQRIDNSKYPQRLFEDQVVFDSIADIRSHISTMFVFGGSFQRPLYVYQTTLTANAASGAVALAFNALATELRDGCQAYLYDKAGGEVVSVNVVNSGGCSLSAGLTRAYAAGAWIVPITTVMSGNNASLSRLNPDYAANAGLTFRELSFLKPFVNPLNAETLTYLAGLPVLTRQPIGTTFDTGFDTGIQVYDSGGIVDIRNRWLHAKLAFQRDFLCHRVMDLADWNWWRVFADYARGSCNPFYMPTWRQDFELHTPPVAGGSTLTFTGTDYANIFGLYNTFKALAITTAGGVQYVTVSSAVASGGNSNVTFAPALPGGTDWGTIIGVSMLVKSRIADDNVVCYHGGLDTRLEINFRTVDA